MTEKRFDWDMNGIFDYENDDEDYISEYEDLSDLLNELSEENEQLKKMLNKDYKDNVLIHYLFENEE